MDRYFYLNSNKEQAGPVIPTEFSRYGINESTMIWKEGMSNWMKAGQIPELSQYFKFSSPPPPPPGGGNNLSGYGNQYKPVMPDNNMVWAILTTLFCCIPIGVYSIIQASKVNTLYYRGQYKEAQEMADSAKKWAVIAAIGGVVIGIICFLFSFLAALIEG